MLSLAPLYISGKLIDPLVEGGKGISVSNGMTAGAWAACGGAGTFSAVNADYYDEKGHLIPIVYREKTRTLRHLELIRHAIRGGIAQARIAHEMSGGRGRIHMNVLWEMGGVEQIVHGILEKCHSLIHGITCGAGMPYRLAQIAAQYKVFYLPIVSSARAFSALWRRAYSKYAQWMGAVVYEDPWKAGGHNGLSNQEDPLHPQSPYERVRALRQTMNAFNLEHIPIVMAGGVWYLREWAHWMDNPELGPMAFQFGTRPLLTQESPISQAWKKRLLTLSAGDVALNTFSPTGFYSSAVRNAFLEELQERSNRQVDYRTTPRDAFDSFILLGRNKGVYVTKEDAQKIHAWKERGFTESLKTPDQTLIFVSPEKMLDIRQDQINCMGCLSACKFSNWKQPNASIAQKPDPRSFCIQKTLQSVSHDGSVENNLLFAGHNAYLFKDDPFYDNGFVPTVQELFTRLHTGD
jgi:nitronate monooxygenase